MSPTNLGGALRGAACSADRARAEQAQRLKQRGVRVIDLWPGKVKTERVATTAKDQGVLMMDHETMRFSGQAAMQSDELVRFASSRCTLQAADVARFECEGYMQECYIFATDHVSLSHQQVTMVPSLCLGGLRASLQGCRTLGAAPPEETTYVLGDAKDRWIFLTWIGGLLLGRQRQDVWTAHVIPFLPGEFHLL